MALGFPEGDAAQYPSPPERSLAKINEILLGAFGNAGSGGTATPGGGTTTPVTAATFAYQTVPESGSIIIAVATVARRVIVSNSRTGTPVTISYNATPVFNAGITTLDPGGSWVSDNPILAAVYAITGPGTTSNITVSVS